MNGPIRRGAADHLDPIFGSCEDQLFASHAERRVVRPSNGICRMLSARRVRWEHQIVSAALNLAQVVADEVRQLFIRHSVDI